ncbi:MAG TPA: SDR family oxidoreductase [Limnobacter sp.]|uniref:SDR family NAD(P)-dependent oxidoreductase n=1 Tax=Limnobacter sp. TaxID=2003368 RepID=UPI002EDB5442
MPSRIFVMGANSAIAQQLIRRCRAAGQTVVAAGRNRAVLEALYGDDDGVMLLEVQATDAASVEAGFSTLQSNSIAIHGYAHCVGSILVAPLVKTTATQMADVLSVNLLSACYGLKEFLKLAKQQGIGGSAVLVSTCATGIGVANHEAIAAAKAGVEGLARSAAATHAADGIRVNVVAPGLTDSPMAQAFLKSEVMRAASEKQYPLHGVNSPDDVASAMNWLLSEEARRITGTVMNVDGGFRNTRPLVK